MGSSPPDPLPFFYQPGPTPYSRSLEVEYKSGGADRVGGRGNEGAGGGRGQEERGGRREKEREEGEGRKMRGREKEENFARATPRRETGVGGGIGGGSLPLFTPSKWLILTSLFPVGDVFLASLFLRKYTDDMVVVSERGGGGLGVLHHKMFGLNGVQSCNSRPENTKIPFQKARDGKLYSSHNLDN